MEKRRGGLTLSGLVWISTFFLILMVILPPFFRTSAGGRRLAEGQYRSRQTEMEVGGSSRRGYSNGVEEECERQVPTGPDPLHHNSNPSP